MGGMARKVRVEYPGATYHLTVRANGRAELLDDDDDRRYLLGRIAEAASTHQVRVYLFCLMKELAGRTVAGVRWRPGCCASMGV